jgi:hypothetical protein
VLRCLTVCVAFLAGLVWYVLFIVWLLILGFVYWDFEVVDCVSLNKFTELSYIMICGIFLYKKVVWYCFLFNFYISRLVSFITIL